MTRQSRALSAILLIGGSTALAACAGSDPTAPGSDRAPAVAPSRDAVGGTVDTNDGNRIPGIQVGATSAFTSGATGTLLGCAPRGPQYGSAIIGPQGGELDVGPHRVIIPAGALLAPTQIWGTVPSDTTVTIRLEPHGLQFRKPAGLILDASACSQIPDAIYVDEAGNVTEHIQAVYSAWWHTVAAPIDHFSNYAIAM